MRRAFATVFFVCGCLMAAFAVIWFVAAQSGTLIVPASPVQAVLGMTVWSIVMLPTLDRYPSRDWRPVFAVTPIRIAFARGLLAVVGLLFVTPFAIAISKRMIGSVVAESLGIWACGGLLLLNGTYVALHWAFRRRTSLVQMCRTGC